MAVRDADFARALLGSLHSGLVGVDRSGRLAALSPAAAAVLGLEPGEPGSWLGRPVDLVLEEHPRVLKLLQEALRGREHPSRAELCVHRADGTPCTLGFTLVAVEDAGEPKGAAMLFRDLTPFERMDEQERLQERLAALGQMAAGLAHEIRNPLAGLELLAGLLKRALFDRPEALALVEELHEELHSLGAAVNARLDFVRPLQPEVRAFSPRSLTEEALARAQARVRFQGVVTLAVEGAPDEAFGDREQLRSVLTNLCVNAFEAMGGSPAEHGHRLLVDVTRAAEGGVQWVVQDTGPGVPEELRERIFYPFFTTRPEGTGVGLAEAQKVLASHGGSISVASGSGGGARFVLHLPDVPAPRCEEAP